MFLIKELASKKQDYKELRKKGKDKNGNCDKKFFKFKFYI
jgi:hypothetical protein